MYLHQSINLHLLIKLSAYFTVTFCCIFMWECFFVCFFSSNDLVRFLNSPSRGPPLLKYPVFHYSFRRQVRLAQVLPCRDTGCVPDIGERQKVFGEFYMWHIYYCIYCSKKDNGRERAGVAVAVADLVCDRGAMLGHE